MTRGRIRTDPTITLREACSDVRVQLLYGVFERSDIITRALKVINAGKTPIVLEKALSMSMDILFGDYNMIFFAGRHAMERTLCRLPVKRAGVHIGSVRGTSSHHYNPSLILCSPQANEDAGDCYGFCLAYSGDFTASAQQIREARPEYSRDPSRPVLLPPGARRKLPYAAGDSELFLLRPFRPVAELSPHPAGAHVQRPLEA